MRRLLLWLKCAWVIARSAFTHPLHTTYVDLSTGECVHVRE